ncbi:MAG: hypothetical protein ACTSQE_11555, partial [Candidatus Heimdallarchaeaceae archaeon]
MIDDAGQIRKDPPLYFQIALSTISKENTLLILPSRFDKACLISYLSKYFLDKFLNKRITIVVSNKSTLKSYNALLINQQCEVGVSFISGETKLEKRIELYKVSKIIVATAH